MDLLLAALAAAFVVWVVDSYYPLGAFRPLAALNLTTLALVLLGDHGRELAVQAVAASFLAVVATTALSYLVVAGDSKVHSLVAQRRGSAPRF